MKGMILTTGTPDTIKLVRSFLSVVPESEVFQYDNCPAGASNQENLMQQVRGRSPDVIVWIGAIKEQHNMWVPSVEELCEFNRLVPMVHLCSDAQDVPWHENLEKFHAAGAFALQVTIDGGRNSPIGRFGMVALTPVHHGWFPDNPSYANRPVHCGFAGGVGCRVDILTPIHEQGLLTHYGNGGHGGAYEALCHFYTTCRTVVNDARTGSTHFRHIKGRFVEAGMGGAVVLEPKDSPAREWFTPGEEFLEWGDPQEAIELIRQADPQLLRYEEMGRRMRARMIEEHSAPVFWAEVFRRIGL